MDLKYPKNPPTIEFSGTALQYSTVDSSTLIVESDYLTTANIIIKNSSPKPDGVRKGAQTVALRVSGDKAAFYNCQILGLKTLCEAPWISFSEVANLFTCVTGSGKGTYFGRAWKARPRVVFAFCLLCGVVNPLGWSDNFQPSRDKTDFFGEHRCTGAQVVICRIESVVDTSRANPWFRGFCPPFCRRSILPWPKSHLMQRQL